VSAAFGLGEAVTTAGGDVMRVTWREDEFPPLGRILDVASG
jgi:hypothetical protein